MWGGTDGQTYTIIGCDDTEHKLKVGESLVVYPGQEGGGDCWYAINGQKYYDGDTFTLTQEIADTFEDYTLRPCVCH